jgi:SpoVK/Ycf46/Vps4 family AAA+-type ATPase
MKFIKAPDKSSTWKDIGGYASVKKSLFDTFRRPMMFRKLYVRNKIKFPRGVMLFGPPGTGKTALARTTGGELGLPLISVRGPELLNKYIGESERAVRSLFDKVCINPFSHCSYGF